jgi:predicted signal transduction protein with EAL and GGDEF domain
LKKEVAERKQIEEQLLHNAFHDGLTGLANRALFMDHLKLALGRAERHGDLPVRRPLPRPRPLQGRQRLLGHMAGDQLLIGVARRLEATMRPGDTVSRLGGDEFTVLLDDLKDDGEAEAVAERLQRELALAFNLGGHEVFTTVSIGIALSRPTITARKRSCATRTRRCTAPSSSARPATRCSTRRCTRAPWIRLGLERDMRRAVERRELFLQYQPIVSLADGSLRGFEALVRWQHPERGLIPRRSSSPSPRRPG